MFFVALPIFSIACILSFPSSMSVPISSMIFSSASIEILNSSSCVTKTSSPSDADISVKSSVTFLDSSAITPFPLLPSPKLMQDDTTVSYTHLTLPTILLV